MSRLVSEAHVLWMERDGEIYSPAMPLRRSTPELIARDLWNGAYTGVCHAVYSYGAYPNGGSFCREVTQDVAERLGEMSFATSDEASTPVRAFLETAGVACREARGGMRREPEGEAFEMVSPPEPTVRTRRNASKRRAKALTPEELRAQPQFKLPIAGGRAEVSRARDLIAESESDEEAGVESVSLRDTRPLAQQKASWDRFRAMIRSWKREDELREAAAEGSNVAISASKRVRAAG